ncbi:MAG: hypothetical protein WA919_11050 [Coleofasciculaceae cyanobacterium]
MKLIQTDRPITLISAIDTFSITVTDKKGSDEPTPVDCYLNIDGFVSQAIDLDPGVDLGKDVTVVGEISLRIAYINQKNDVVDKTIELGVLSLSGFVPTPKAIATLGLSKIASLAQQIHKTWDLSARLEAAIAKAASKKQRNRQKIVNAIAASTLF